MKVKRISNDAFSELRDRFENYEKLWLRLKVKLPPWYKIIHDILSQGPLLEQSMSVPIVLNRIGREIVNLPTTFRYKSTSGVVVLYQNLLYQVEPTYSNEEIGLLVMEETDKERQKFERLKSKLSTSSSELVHYNRQPIPEEVRITVWRRDQGRCVQCGSKENLEYDHLIPVSLGGSNTVRNIQLLCELCNRQKSNNI